MEAAAARLPRSSTTPLPPPARPLDDHRSRSSIPHPRRLPDRAFSLSVSTQPVEVLWVPFGHRELLFALCRARRSLPGMPVWSEMSKGDGSPASTPLVAPVREEEAAAASLVTPAGEEEAVAASAVAREGHDEAAGSSDGVPASMPLVSMPLVGPVGEHEAAAASPAAPLSEDEAVAASPIARPGREEAAVSSLVCPLRQGEAPRGSPVEPTDADV